VAADVGTDASGAPFSSVFPASSPRSSSSSCRGLISVYAPGPMYMRPSGWSQKGPPPSSGSETAFEDARSLLVVVVDCLDDWPRVLLLLICC
jgi:hypothetical protein